MRPTGGPWPGWTKLADRFASVRVAVPAETIPGERRVAITPETAAQLVGAGLDVVVQAGAGQHASIPDAAYAASGAEVVEAVDAGRVDVLLHVRPLHAKLPERLRAGAVTIGMGSPSTELPTVAALRDAQVTSFAMELVPRISRAQSMDALTSQALVAGYRCTLEAAMRRPRFFPLCMTAAGTGAGARSRRRWTAGHRDRTALGRQGLRVRRATGVRR